MAAQELVFAWLQLAGQEGFVEIVWWDYLKVLAVLAVLAAGAYALVRYVGPRVPTASGASGPIRVLTRYALEPRKALYLIQVGEETLLVGSAENSLSLIRTLPPGTIDLSQFDRRTQSAPGAFLEKLRELQARK
jgi:flagellar biogenesis protein FliO